MAPTLVFRPEGIPWLVLGSPGGSRFLGAMLQMWLHWLADGLNMASAANEPRIHSQLRPDLGASSRVSAPTPCGCCRRWALA